MTSVRKYLLCVICKDQCKKSEVVRIDQCKHVACEECFKQYCTKGVRFPLTCFKSGCGTLPYVHQVRNSLPAEAMDALLLAALQDKLKKHPEKYAVCPSVNCARYLEVPEQPERQTSIGCASAVRVKCNVEYHERETCEEFRIRNAKENEDEAMFQEWMSTSNAKQCTRCLTAIEKIEGCNHMHCLGCKAEMCWFCMTICKNATAVYEHMRDVHGNYGEEVEVEDYEQEQELEP